MLQELTEEYGGSLNQEDKDGLVLCDGNGGEAVCKIASLCPESVILDVEERRKSLAEPKTRVTLYQAIPKSDKLEYIVQKAVYFSAIWFRSEIMRP